MQDKQGRQYAKYDDLKEGQTVWLDGGFTCVAPGPQTVLKDATGFYIKCCEGEHFLDGQFADDGEHLVGVYPADPGPLEWENKL